MLLSTTKAYLAGAAFAGTHPDFDFINKFHTRSSALCSRLPALWPSVPVEIYVLYMRDAKKLRTSGTGAREPRAET